MAADVKQLELCDRRKSFQIQLSTKMEALASTICNKDDPTLLTSKEIRQEYGSCTNFMQCHGLKPYNMDDIDEAKAISRAFKQDMVEEAAQAQRNKK